MQIQVNTDRHIHGSEELSAQVRAAIASELSRFSERITRVEVHLSDENGATKGGGADMRCVMEARLNGLQPTAVTEKAESIDLAIVGAAEKLRRAIENTIGRLKDR